MAEIGCTDCALRAKYDSKPKSILGRIWKFHIKFCPGWKAYLKSLPNDERQEVYDKYGFRKI